MTLEEIRKFPTCVDDGPNKKRIHESCLRSFHIVEKVKELIEAQCPPSVMRQIIDDLSSAKGSDYDSTL